MPSPFPGMDPYIEGQIWADFHDRVIVGAAEALTQVIRPRYMAVIEQRVYVEREPQEGPQSAMRPDISMARSASLPGATGERGGTALLAEPVLLPISMPDTLREPFLEIRLREGGELVTIIEVLSPGNKRPGSDGRREYLGKRDIVLLSGTHLVELDLLRGGERMPMDRPLPAGDFYALVSRARQRPMTEVWAFTLRHRLPTVGIPLAGNDPAVPLDLQAVFDTVYDRAGYDYVLDYRRPVDPPLPAEAADWATSLLPAA